MILTPCHHHYLINLVGKAHVALVKLVPRVQEAASHLRRSQKKPKLRVVSQSPLKLSNWIPHCYHSRNFSMLLLKCPSLQTPMIACGRGKRQWQTTTDDKRTAGQYLAHNDRKGLRDFLSSASDTTLDLGVQVSHWWKLLTSLGSTLCVWC
jgi:hypothetical protein